MVLGPADNILIRNVTTDELLDLSGYSLPAGETVTFDLRFGYKTVTSSADDNIVGYLTEDSDLATFHLDPHPFAPNGVNSLFFSASNTTADTRLSVRWHDRYLGI